MEENKSAPQEGNAEKVEGVVMPPEKIEDWKRKLSGSKAEAMRLKAEAARLSDEKTKLEAELKAARTGQGQSYGYTPTTDEIDLFRQLAQQAGVPLREDLEAIKAQDYEKEKKAIVDQFLQSHPEYANVGDPDSDELWEQLNAEVNQYPKPKNASDYAMLLNKGHRLVSYDATKVLEKGVSLGMAKAHLKEQGRIGGGGSSGQNAPIKKVPAERKTVEDGFKALRPEAFN